MGDGELGELCLRHLQPLLPDVRERYLGCQVLRTPIAYPIYLQEYEAERLKLQQSTGVAGLHSIGRNGEFAHILMEDVYWRTLRRVRQVVAGLSAPRPAVAEA
jgi:protoporphyrinogen oxidase